MTIVAYVSNFHWVLFNGISMERTIGMEDAVTSAYAWSPFCFWFCLSLSLPFLSAFSAALYFWHSAILCPSFWQKKHFLGLLGFVKFLAAVLGFIVLFEQLLSCCGCTTTIAFSVFLPFPAFSPLAALAPLTASALAFAVCTKPSWNYLDERVHTMSIALFVGSLRRSSSMSVVRIRSGYEVWACLSHVGTREYVFATEY